MFRSPMLIPNIPNGIKSPQEVINELLAINHQLIMNLNQANTTMAEQHHDLMVKEGLISAQAQMIAESQREAKLTKDELAGARVVSQAIYAQQGKRVTQLNQEVQYLRARIDELEKNSDSNSQKVYLLLQPLSSNSLFNKRKARFPKKSAEKNLTLPFIIKYL